MFPTHRLATRVALAFVLWLTLAAAAPAQTQTMRVHVIDVGQGAATLVEFPCAAMLIDTGGELSKEFDSVDKLESYLEDFFFARTDLKRTFHSLILTHPHIDHTRGVSRLLDRYKILNAVTNGQEPDDIGGTPQKLLHRRIAQTEMSSDPNDDIGFVAAEVDQIPANTGLTNGVIDPIKCDTVDPKITVLWGALDRRPSGWSSEEFRNENNHSVVTRIDFGAASLLVTGDLEFDGIDSLLEHYAGSKLLDADVYQVGHHGSFNATTSALLRAVTPKIAVIAMGPHDREDDFTAWAHGHPRKATVERLEDHVTGTRDRMPRQVATGQRRFEPMPIDKAIYATGWDGSVVLETDTAGTWKVIKPRTGPAPRLVDINRAGAPELEQLVGRARAEELLKFRSDKGGTLKEVKELREMKGLGPATLLSIRNILTAGQCDDAQACVERRMK
jgi:competence protein ComEC